jgi:ribonuclease HII
MPWVVGIDEAGYGPNLGPLVQAAVALYLPDSDPAGWATLKAAVRRAHEKADGRLLIDDSKKVYAKGGLEALERGVTPLTPWSCDLGEFVRKACRAACAAELAGEAWYDPAETLPLTSDRVAIEAAWSRRDIPQYPGGKPFAASVVASVVPAPQFNRVVDESGSKATVLSRGLVDLLAEVMAQQRADAAEPLLVSCDKQGGRNFYTPLLQDAFPDGWVVAERESADESRYRVELLPRPVTVTFRPRADGDSVVVALASMVCKYLREVCMRQFNRFWAAHVPGIAPTAGYPVDAKRFYAEIQPAMAKLGLTADRVWRKK